MELCNSCNREFKTVQALNGHKAWCDVDSRDKERRLKLFSAAGLKGRHNRSERIRWTATLKLDCQRCNRLFIVVVTERQLKTRKYTRHCSRSCANSRKQTNEIRKKKSATLKAGYESGRLRSWSKGKTVGPRARKMQSVTGCIRPTHMISLVSWVCQNCGAQKTVRQSAYNCKTCGKECARQLSSKRMAERVKNKQQTQRIKCVYYMKNGTSIPCDSKIEYACLDWFETHHDIIDARRCDVTLAYEDFDDKLRHTTPDFVITTQSQEFIVECKNHSIGKSLNKKWHLYKQLIPFKQKALEQHAQKNGMVPMWFTPKMHQKFYISLFGKDMNILDSKLSSEARTC